MKRKLAWIAAVIVAAVAALALRVVIEGRTALADGDAAIADKRPIDAIAAWESAARWYLPFASHVDDAYERLRDYGRGHRSIVAWRSVRSAARATRGLWQPHAEDLAEADAALVELAVADPERAPMGGTDPAKYGTWVREQLARDPHPSSGSAVLAILGIIIWLVGMTLAIRRPAWRNAAISAGGLAAWALGVYTA